MKMKKICFSILLAGCMSLTMSCGESKYSDDVESALALAKDNRSELEKVLKHYEGDTLKMKAAEFLIANMPGHYSYADTTEIMAYDHEADSLITCMQDSTDEALKAALDSVAGKYRLSEQKIVNDIEIITADFLIRNIDDAFAAWKEGNWATHLDFDMFCEYLLPYKVRELQLLDDWRTRLKGFYSEQLSELQYSDIYSHSALEASKSVNQALQNAMNPNNANAANFMPPKIETACRMRFGSCDQYALIAAIVMRSHGIPIACDFTSQWAFRNLGHSWNMVPANDGKHIAFSGVCTTPGEPHKLDERMAKAFRRTYAKNREIEDMLLRQRKNGEYTPGLFHNVFLKDVTAEYIDCADVVLENDDLDGEYAYLAVFDNKNWVPVAYGKVDGHRVTFHDMGKNIMYYLVKFSKNGEMQMLGMPFILQYDGNIRNIIPNKSKTQKMVLHRKYPVLDYVYTYLQRLKNGEFQASNSPDFSNYYLLHKIKDISAYGFEVKVPDSIPPCRYWRYYTNQPGAFSNMAEIYFLKKDSLQASYGRVIGTDGSWNDSPSNTKNAVFDKNILTFFDAPELPESWVGMDFGAPVRFDRLVYYGRGDGNGIELGDNYELLYWDEGRWVSLGYATAIHPVLVYPKVPKGALFLLRDHTKGKDERIFTYENGKQIWW